MGFSGFSIALLWSVGVIAEIVIFAISPRFREATTLVIIGAASAIIRWIHGVSRGSSDRGSGDARPVVRHPQIRHHTLLVRSMPHHLLASAQGYLVAFGGIVSAITVVMSGLLYAQFGSGVYFAMAAMGAAGSVVMPCGASDSTHIKASKARRT